MTVAEELEKSPILRTGICLANLQESHSNAGLHCVMRDSSSIDDHSSKQLFTANSKFPSFLSYLLRTSTNKIHLFSSRQTPFPFFFFFLIPSYPTAAEMFLLFRILILHYVYIPSSQVPTSSSCWFLVLHLVYIPNFQLLTSSPCWFLVLHVV